MSKLGKSAKDYFDHYDQHLIQGKKILSLNNVGSSEVCLLNTRCGVVFPTLVYIIHQGEEKLWILCIGGKKIF